MKKIYFVIVALLTCSAMFAQTVAITANPGTSGNIVVGQSNYHASESIYTDSEIGSGNFTTAGSAIQEVYFFVNTLGTGTTIGNFKLYMKDVPIGTTTFANGTYSLLGYTLVYSGSLTATPVGPVGVTLTTPYVRAAGTNLQVLILREDNTLHTGYIFDAAVGNDVGSTELSSRRYNNTTAPAAGSTTLTGTNFRPAIAFVHTYAIDAEILDIATPGITCYNTPQTLSVYLYNAGTSSIAAGAAAVTVKVGGANTYSGTQNNTGAIASGAFEIINFTGINLNNAGTNIDTAYVTLAGDGTTFNDTLVTASVTASTLSTFPLVEDAEATLTPFPVFNYAEVINIDQLWTVQTGSYTNPDMTNPLAPRAPGNQFYLFDSYSGASTLGYSSRLFSNCISIPSNSTALMTFYMSHDNIFPTDLDSLYISVSTDKGATWTRVGPGFQRPDATAAIPVWRIESVDLTAYAGQTIQIGFEGESKYGNAFGVDDIEITVTSLPIVLLSFDAARNGSVNNLKWSTSQEQNSSRFIVERSSNGRSFEEIGVVAASGYSNETRNYRFTDPSPVKGVNYYRLRMIDMDNTFKYSEVKNVRNMGAAEIAFSPNPVIGQIRLSIDADKAERANIRITDISGKQVYSGSFNVVNGTNVNMIDTDKLAAGTYFLQVQMSEGNLVKKFTKL